uniref:S phase cyclin A-associated protein in the endoplasmic reticulum-like n=1 Tax=Phallusia mammillata TaxID=59560 RepID=A0A6F9DSD7_9ASCI|nr:S phase cyclin A-associated protein in the endoplasmic reticulum-like [Phallusia mammillata]
MRKRAKKLRIRMAARGKEFLKRVELKAPTLNGTNKTKVVRLIKDANRQLTNQKECSGPWPANRVTAFDRTLGEIVRCLEKEAATDQSAFRIGGGFEMLERIFEIYFRGDSNPDLPAILPDRLLGNAASCFRFACAGNHDNCVYAVYSNRVMGLVDALLPQISKNEVGEATKSNTPRAAPASQSKKTTSSLPKVDNMFDPASPSLLRALAVTLSMMAGNPPTEESVKPKSKSFTQMIPAPNNEHRKVLEVYLNRGLDVISYIVASRVLDVLGQYLSNVRHEVAPGSNLAAFVESGLKFLESATSFVTMRNRLSADNHQHASKHKSATNNNKTTSCEGDSAVNQWDNDPTQLLPTLQHTELMGIVSVLYGLLLHGAPERPTTLRSAAEDEQRASIQPQTLNVALAVMKVLNAVAEMDLRLLQASLGAEGVSLEYRHICTYLLWYCVQGEHTELLHEVIVSVGHFTLDNRNNQNIVDSGAQPTVLQQLCLLPFAYFSSAKPMRILLPTLIACCHDNPSNLTIMEQEASASLLINFIQTFLEESTEKQKTKKSDKKRNGILADLDRGTSLVDHPLFTTDYLNKSWTFFTDKQS